jgi:hypothetical protein
VAGHHEPPEEAWTGAEKLGWPTEEPSLEPELFVLDVPPDPFELEPLEVVAPLPGSSWAATPTRTPVPSRLPAINQRVALRIRPTASSR